ncbi:hypothetical protein GCM10009087_52560 [Sphingomonas oligophenolica]|uniref:Uncharacterized protein n=1 Tax=Sphingomonas oligophenolica TaxID=301154 RepID=A0ABU9Y725_9SPHN
MRMDNETGTILLAIFPLLFIALWLAMTAMLGLFSGWFALQNRYPDKDETALLTLRSQSGMMGKRVGMNGVLTLGACPSGLRIGIWRAFGLFQRPFLVPWEDITAEPKTFFFVPMARLGFGHPEIGSLTLDAGTWQSLSAHSPARARRGDAFEPVSRGQVAQGLLLQWAIISGGFTAFFAVAALFETRNAPVPPLIFAFPVVAVGIAQLVRFARMRF